MNRVVPRVVVLQDGARLHYAVPMALQKAGALERVYTDWYSAPGSLARLGSKFLALAGSTQGKRMLERVYPGLDARRIHASFWTTLRAAKKRKQFVHETDYYAFQSRQMAKWVLRKGFGNANAIFGFIRNIHPDLLKSAKENGLATFADQMIAPREVELAEEHKQNEKFPDWAPSGPGSGTDTVIDFEKATWMVSDVISCASEYVRSGLIRSGIADENIFVNPYPIDLENYPVVARNSTQKPVTVGFVGGVGLRKGTPYFFEIAKRLKSKMIRFVMVGPISISKSALLQRGDVELVGSVPRSEVANWLRSFDIFLFPSTCEGSAGAVSEAMASGLPVIASRNAGSPATGQLPNHNFEYNDIEGMADAIERFVSDRSRILSEGRESRKFAETLTIAEFGKKMILRMESAMLSCPASNAICRKV